MPVIKKAKHEKSEWNLKTSMQGSHDTSGNFLPFLYCPIVLFMLLFLFFLIFLESFVLQSINKISQVISNELLFLFLGTHVLRSHSSLLLGKMYKSASG
jgi:hypothetical protein